MTALLKRIIICGCVLVVSLFPGCTGDTASGWSKSGLSSQAQPDQTPSNQAKSQSTEPEKTELFVMSTYVTQQIYGSQKKQAAQRVNELLTELDAKLSLYQPNSDISRINQNAGIAPVEVDEYTFELIQTAKRYSQLSGGTDDSKYRRRFDVTIAPVTLLWGIDTDHATVPTSEQLTTALALVNCENIQLDEENSTVYLKEKGMALDLGGIAKGHMARRIGEEYKKFDITSAMVSIGGNICVYGRKPGDIPYKLGIRDPKSSSSSAIMGTITVPEDLVLSTTGAYERFFEQDGVRYHHVLDPTTGYPADSDLLSVTVLCEDGGLADYLSTTLFIAGKEALASYLNDSRFDVIVIDSEGTVYLSDRIQSWFALTGDGYQMFAGEQLP